MYGVINIYIYIKQLRTGGHHLADMIYKDGPVDSQNHYC